MPPRLAAEFFVVDFEVGPSARTTDISNRRDVAPGCGAVRLGHKTRPGMSDDLAPIVEADSFCLLQSLASAHAIVAGQLQPQCQIQLRLGIALVPPASSTIPRW